MYAAFIVMFFGGLIAIAAAVNVSIAPENHLPRTVAEAEASAPALLAVREAAFAYAATNATSNGTVIVVSSLGSTIRAPLVNLAAYSSMVAGGYLYVWAGGVWTGTPSTSAQIGGQSIARQMFELSGGSRLVGYNDSGVFTHPIYGATSLSLPPQIPNGAAVAMRPIA